jgi:hypothetical protein
MTQVIADLRAALAYLGDSTFGRAREWILLELAALE